MRRQRQERLPLLHTDVQKKQETMMSSTKLPPLRQNQQDGKAPKHLSNVDEPEWPKDLTIAQHTKISKNYGPNTYNQNAPCTAKKSTGIDQAHPLKPIVKSKMASMNNISGLEANVEERVPIKKGCSLLSYRKLPFLQKADRINQSKRLDQTEPLKPIVKSETASVNNISGLEAKAEEGVPIKKGCSLLSYTKVPCLPQVDMTNHSKRFDQTEPLKPIVKSETSSFNNISGLEAKMEEAVPIKRGCSLLSYTKVPYLPQMYMTNHSKRLDRAEPLTPIIERNTTIPRNIVPSVDNLEGKFNRTAAWILDNMRRAEEQTKKQ